MKVIDLLNKIANGEEVPKYINYTHKVFGENTMMVCKENIINELDTGAIELNDEVEIIEEDKKIKKIDLSEWAEITYLEDWEMLTKDFNRNSNLFVKKINEIIDYLEEKE